MTDPGFGTRCPRCAQLVAVRPDGQPCAHSRPGRAAICSPDAICGAVWDGSEKPFPCGLPTGHDGQHSGTYSTETASATARWSDR